MARIADLDGLGVGRGAVHERCGPDGPWRRLLPGVVLLHRRTPTRAEWRRAALLYAGQGSVLTGVDALVAHDLLPAAGPDHPVHVLVPHPRRRHGTGRVLVDRTHRMPTPLPGPVPHAPVTRAAVDHYRRRSGDREARAVLAEMLRRGLCSASELEDELRISMINSPGRSPGARPGLREGELIMGLPVEVRALS